MGTNDVMRVRRVTVCEFFFLFFSLFFNFRHYYSVFGVFADVIYVRFFFFVSIQMQGPERKRDTH